MTATLDPPSPVLPHDPIGYVGPFRLTRELTPVALGRRYLALHEREATSHLVYILPLGKSRRDHRVFLAAASRLNAACNPYLLSTTHSGLIGSSSGYLISPYPGTADGVLTLADLASARLGRFSAFEARRGLCHLLTGVAAGQAAGLGHGPFGPEDVLVDRHGRLIIELYGLRANLYRGGADTGAEVRSVGGIGRLLLGGEASVRREDRPLREALAGWVIRAEDGHWASASSALAALPETAPATSTGVRPAAIVMDWVKRWLGPLVPRD